jgi:hypothetical protein
LIKLDGGVDFLSVVGSVALKRVEGSSLSIDFILDDNVVEDAVEVEDILDVGFEVFAITGIFG